MNQRYSHKLGKDDFKKLLDFLGIASCYINDLDIKEGVIRQMTPDNFAQITMDISSLLPKDLCVADVKTKLSLLELIATDDKSEANIEAMEKLWFVYDKKTVFRWPWAMANRMSTQYIPDDKFAARFEDNTTPDMKIFEIDMVERDDLHKKIKKVTETFNSDAIIFKIDEKNISMSVESMDKKSMACLFKIKNDAGISPHEIILRSGFVDRIDGKILKRIEFYTSMKDNATVSITKAICELEGAKLEIHTFSKCSK